MGLDDIKAAADRAHEEARAGQADRAARADEAARQDLEFRATMRDWLADVARRLSGAGLRHELAEEPLQIIDPGPSVGLDAAIGWWRGAEKFRPRDWFRGADEPPEPEPPLRIEGWCVYACLPATPHDPLGQPVHGIPVPVSTGGTESIMAREALFVTATGRGLVVQDTFAFPRSEPGAPGTSRPRFSLRPVGGSMLGLVGREADTLTRAEIFTLSGLRRHERDWYPHDETREDYRARLAFAEQDNAENFANQLVLWETGVRHLLAAGSGG